MQHLKFREFVNDKFHYWGFVEEGIFKGPVTPSLTRGKHYQFTGLKDKEGKEVYAGDLYQIAANKIYLVKFCDGGESNFEWYGGTFCLYLDESLFFPFDEYAMKTGKVIGNTSENPELWREGV